MLKYILGLALLVFASCNNNKHVISVPINPNELTYKKGDCLSFQIDSLTRGAAIVIDYSKDEGGLWYGLCFTNYLDTIKPTIPLVLEKKIFGRKIESSLDPKGFIIGLDFEYVNGSCLKLNNTKFSLIGNINLNFNKIKMGSDGATNDYSDMIHSFRNGLEKRLLPPDDYREHRRKLDDFRPDEYFLLKDYVIEK